jgi:hypothetical protein
MGFSSWNCAVDNTSIPAYPYANKPQVESEVVLVLPDDTTVEGVYDGYGRISGKQVLETVHKQLKLTGDVYSDQNFTKGMDAVKMVKKYNYTGQKYEDLSKSLSCEYQGYFYPENFDPALPEVLNGVANDQIRPEETVR